LQIACVRATYVYSNEFNQIHVHGEALQATRIPYSTLPEFAPLAKGGLCFLLLQGLVLRQVVLSGISRPTVKSPAIRVKIWLSPLVDWAEETQELEPPVAV
jgi:hypothetical protein